MSNAIGDLVEENYKLKEEIERLTELCNKYEEEHKTTFETWQKDIKENKLLHSIIKEAREYIENCLHNLEGTNDSELKQCIETIHKYVLEILDKVGSDKE